MTSDMAKYDVESKIHVALLRYRGDISQVVKVTGYDHHYVQKIARKQKNKRRHDVSVWVADSIMETILTGYEQRLEYLQKCLLLLEGKEEAFVSLCHGDPVEVKQIRRTPFYICLKCNQRASVKLKTRNDVFALIVTIVESLREEDRSLVEFADKMGYTKKSVVPVQDNRQNLFIFAGSNTSKGMDGNIVKQIEGMSPLERERTRKQLSSTLIDMAKGVTVPEKK
jgi:hypothetical protein